MPTPLENDIATVIASSSPNSAQRRVAVALTLAIEMTHAQAAWADSHTGDTLNQFRIAEALFRKVWAP